MRLNIGSQTRDNKEKKEMAAKQAEITAGSDLAAMEKESESLRAELGAIDKMLASGDGSVSELESSIIRQQAINLRLKALSAKMEAERVRLAELKRKQNAEQSREYERQADQYMKDIIVPLLEANRIALLAKSCEEKAGALKEYGSFPGPGLKTVNLFNLLLPSIAPDRFSTTNHGSKLVDKENPNANA